MYSHKYIHFYRHTHYICPLSTPKLTNIVDKLLHIRAERKEGEREEGGGGREMEEEDKQTSSSAES